jgi:hypothetical protein
MKLEGTDQQKQEQVKRLSGQEARRGFDLSRWPLIRVKLLEVSEQESVMVMTMHHIVSDGWSMGIFVKEMVELYASYSRGEEPGLKEPSTQYADYATWQREYVSGEEMERQLERRSCWRLRRTVPGPR